MIQAGFSPSPLRLIPAFDYSGSMLSLLLRIGRITNFGDLMRMTFRLIVACYLLALPLVLSGQSSATDTEQLHQKIDELSRIVEQLKAEKSLSGDIGNILDEHARGFTVRDSMRLVSLKQKQEESRARIDALTLEVIRLSKQLEDPNKRFALAKRMKQNQLTKLNPEQNAPNTESSVVDSISAQAIDLAAVKLVREGKTLDQARLLIIDKLTVPQVLDYYQNQSKEDRYALYDISDNIIREEGSDISAARRTAIYFFLFTDR